jgi:hypothetical protein
VGVFGNAAARPWTHAGLVPGVVYGAPPSAATWTDPGDPVETLADADRVFSYQGTVMVGDEVATYHAAASEAEFRRGVLLTLARITDLLMLHDIRLRTVEE